MAALGDGDVTFDGDPRSHERPMRPLVESLRALGVDIDDAGRGSLPFVVHGHGSVKGGTVSLDASTSSQFVSGLLLAAPRFDEGIEVRHVGEPVPSAPHLRMSVAMLRAAGATVDDATPGRVAGLAGSPARRRRSSSSPTCRTPLPSSRPPWSPEDVRRSRTGRRPRRRPATPCATCSRRWAPTVTLDGDGLTVTGGPLDGIDADLHEVGELTPTLAALAAVARTPSRLRGVAHLRGHETDRLAALVASLGALGGDVRETEDGLEIRPVPLHGGVFETYDDHRMATAGAVLGLVVPGVEVVDVATTTKTLPDFVGQWLRMLGR